ncbi:MAG: ribosome assembly cofactor RimP [Salibacteraceae bacterium]
MIVETLIRDLVNAAIEGTDEFVVHIQVNAGNRISVQMDSDSGLTIDRCVAISRAVEGALDRDEEDFELSVSSPGVGQPLQMPRQYRKNIGRKVAVITGADQRIEGELREASEESILVVSRSKKKKEVGKGRVWVETEHDLPFSEIKETKVLVSFK